MTWRRAEMRQRPLICGHPEGPRELERLVPDRKEAVMTGITISAWAGIVGEMSAWVRRQQRALSARVHVAGDERARSHGWTVTETTGRFGFGARIYRDSRFGAPRPALAAAPAAQQSPPARCVACTGQADSVVLDAVHGGLGGLGEEQAAWYCHDIQTCHHRRIGRAAVEGPAGRSHLDQRPSRLIAGR
jgi:hypothetical protein